MRQSTALRWSAFWFLVAFAFGAGVTAFLGTGKGVEFFTGYVVEQALSIDNLFVMMLVFARFGVPRAAQRRVLNWGIAGVVVLRGLMIVTGTAVIERFHVLTYLLGGMLLYAALKLARELGDPASEAVAPEPPADPPGMSRVRALVSRIVPISDTFDGDRFTVVKNGIRHATPLLVALVAIETADAIFALDSVPAVLGITTDRFIVFTSNLFAVLGLRSLYFALSGLLERLRYLEHGLVGVLAIVGTKMLLAVWWDMPTWLSLACVMSVLGAAIVASLSTSTNEARMTNAEQS